MLDVSVHDAYSAIDQELGDEEAILGKLTDGERKLVDAEKFEVPQASKINARHCLQLTEISVEHNKHHIVDHLSMTVFCDEVFVVIGENGSGKSAVMQTIAGMMHVHGGKAEAFGYDMLHAARFITTNFMAYNAQEEILIDQLTTEAHIECYCKFLGIEDVEETTKNLLWEYDLQECANIVAMNCSKIQRKRLSVALALLGKTKVVLLDEPTTGMDIASKRQMWKIIRKHRRGRCIIVATQDMEEARALADRIGLLSHGKLMLAGSP